MPYNPIAIANYFIEQAESHGETLTAMKLQKLVFFAHGWYLAIKNAPLIDEQVEAWPYGPVIRSLYREFREYGDRNITEKVSVFKTLVKSDGRRSRTILRPTIDDNPESATFTKQFLDRVWEVYSKFTAIQLSNMTHEVGTPWRLIHDSYDGKPPKGTDIPSDSIKKYFQDLARSKAQSQ